VGDRPEVLVIGAGPGGIAAAVTAAEGGARVVLVDESPRVGGQVWHGEVPKSARPWLGRLERSGARVLGATSIFDADPQRIQTTAGEIGCDRMVLACGGRELLLPFTGWTLPGVTGAGGLQALVHDGLDVRGQRIVIGGTGPLLLEAARVVRRRGARVVRIAEQAPFRQLLAFLASLPATKKREGLRLASPALRTSSWVESVDGEDSVRTAVVRTPLRRETIECDRVAVGHSVVPNLELPRRLGCEVTPRGVMVDEDQQTSIDGVYAVGEICGIKGAAGALLEGICAGLAVTGQAIPESVRAARAVEHEFGRGLAETFELRPEVLDLAVEDTILCRCEDVRTGELAMREDWTSAKLHTRCGMGACQGRVCGSATRELFGWGPGAPRPPLVPVPVGMLMNERNEP
jgi:NADPH-dependent 2,4-dienoyl-CoA reductase/sulfur reductase-like enzyme